ncbi:MAG: AmmeMemoRadiSam system radical SAM enzyme [Acidobacteria bacterium]|nr:AmmeMemoRadiSam system radical SAM enzyme [Acidobacteriota bacterium]
MSGQPPVEASFYRKLDGSKIRCELCPHFCELKEGKLGICRGRRNIGGRLIAENYGNVCSIAIDPIEKKPLYHLYPGSRILSTGPNGCNLRCKFCQNWEISQEEIPTKYVSPEELIDYAIKNKSIGVAYTYTEPLIWYEYVMDCAKLARQKGLINVLVSNGTINPEPFNELLPFIDGINIDLKSINPDFYKKLCGSELAPVKEIIKLAAGRTMLEITNLLITDENDSDEEINQLVDFIAGINPEIPVHFSRYSPRYRMENPATDSERLFGARKIAQKKLKYVYLGNISDEESSTTFCPECGAEIVRRGWFSGAEIFLKDGKCPSCSAEINIRY